MPSDVAWSEISAVQLAQWRPPISEAGDTPVGSRGPTSVLRWLLHRVLPCPGLLLSDLYAAWSIGIEPAGFAELCDAPNHREWVQALHAARYDGAAKDLTSRRWWAAGIDFLSWQLRERADALGDVQAALDELAGSGIRPLAAASWSTPISKRWA